MKEFQYVTGGRLSLEFVYILYMGVDWLCHSDDLAHKKNIYSVISNKGMSRKQLDILRPTKLSACNLSIYTNNMTLGLKSYYLGVIFFVDTSTSHGPENNVPNAFAFLALCINQ